MLRTQDQRKHLTQYQHNPLSPGCSRYTFQHPSVSLWLPSGPHSRRWHATTAVQSPGQEDFLDHQVIPSTPRIASSYRLWDLPLEDIRLFLKHPALLVSIYNPQSTHCPIPAAGEGEKCRWGRPFCGGLDALQLALAYRSQEKTKKGPPGRMREEPPASRGTFRSFMVVAQPRWHRHGSQAQQAAKPAQPPHEQLQTNFLPPCFRLGLVLASRLCCWLMAFGNWHGKWDFTEQQGMVNWNDKIILVVH